MSGKATAILDDAQPAVSPSQQPTELPKIDDYYKWSMEQAAHIRAGRFDQVDALNVADEIEDVAKSEVRALRSNLENVLVHLLKWDVQPQRRSRSWVLSIDEHRKRVSQTLAENPSMAGKWDENAARAYELARVRAARETSVLLKRFPEQCPYDREAIMSAPYEIDRD